MEGKFTDEAFFQKLQEGDEGKLKELFNDFFALFVAFARNYLGQDDTCEDIVQDTFVAFWEQRASFKNIYYVKAFFYKTIRHKCLNYIRHQKLLALDGCSNDEIAEKLGISVNTVRTHKARTYQYLRERLGELRILLLVLFSTY